MRITQSILLPALYCASKAAASVAGSVYIYDAGKREISDNGRTLSPIAARLVLAQRAGVEEYHSADIRREEAMQAINDFGTTSQLFGGEDKERQQHIFIMEVPEEHDEAFSMHGKPTLAGDRLLIIHS
jgi:hypothetical protein